MPAACPPGDCRPPSSPPRLAVLNLGSLESGRSVLGHGSCRKCHQLHTSKLETQLKQDMPLSQSTCERTASLCSHLGLPHVHSDWHTAHLQRSRDQRQTREQTPRRAGVQQPPAAVLPAAPHACRRWSCLGPAPRLQVRNRSALSYCDILARLERTEKRQNMDGSSPVVPDFRICSTARANIRVVRNGSCGSTNIACHCRSTHLQAALLGHCAAPAAAPAATAAAPAAASAAAPAAAPPAEPPLLRPAAPAAASVEMPVAEGCRRRCR